MRIAAVIGIGRTRSDRIAYKTQEIEEQKREALQFLDEVQREKDALLNQLKAQTRLRAGGHDDGHPRPSH